MKSIKKKENQTGVNIPGKVFEKHIQFGTPSIQGVYLCFYRPHKISDEVYPVAGLEISNWYKDSWGTKNMVLAFIGPLPVPLLDQLYENKECIRTVFYIGTLKTASQGKFLSGPHFQYRMAEIQNGREGRFIFMIEAQKTASFPIAKYDTSQSKWVPIQNMSKYMKVIGKYRKTANLNPL